MTNRTEDDARKYVVKRIKDGTLRAVNFFKWLESSSAEKKVAQTRLSNILLKIVNEEIRIKCPNLEEALTLAKAIRQQLEDDSFKYYWLQKRQDEEGQVRAGNWWVPARKRFEEYAAAAQPPRTTQKPPSSPEPVPDSQDLQLQKRKRSPSTPDLEDDGNAADVQNHLVDLREAVEFSEETLLGQCGSNTWMIEHVSGLINFTKAMDPFLQQKGRHLLKLWRDAAMVGADQMRGSSTDELTEYPITKIKNWSGEEYGAIVMGLVALQETGKLGDAEPSFRHIVGKVMGTVKTSRAYEPSGIEFQSLCGCLKRLSKLDVSRPVQDEQDVRFVWAALIGECLPARCQTEISLEYRHNFSDAAVTKSDITMFVLHRAFSIGYAVIEVQPGEDEPHKDHHKAPVELYEQITKFLHATAVDMAEIEQFRFHYGLIYRWRIEWFCVYPIVIGDLIVLKRCIGPSFAIGQYTTRLLAALNLFEYIVKEVLPTGELIQRSLARSQTPNADIIAKLAWRQPNAQPVSRRTKCLFTPAKSRQ